MFKRNLAGILTAAAIGAGAALPATAATVAVDFTVNPSEVGTNGPWNLGYSFIVNSAIEVTALGYFDGGLDGLAGDRLVTLWDDAGGILAQATVLAGTSSTLIGNFRFENLGAAVALTVGETYYVSAFVPDGDHWHQDPVGGVAGLVVAPEITYESRRFTSGGAGTQFPDLAGSGTAGYFGGNFLFGGTITVPEPATLGILGLGLAGVGLMRRRKSA